MANQTVCQFSQAVLGDGLASLGKLQSRGNDKNPTPRLSTGYVSQFDSRELFKTSCYPDTVLLKATICRANSKTPALAVQRYSLHSFIINKAAELCMISHKILIIALVPLNYLNKPVANVTFVV